MKYLCLIYDDETRWDRMGKEEAGTMYGEYRTYTEGITHSGHYLGGNPLQPTRTATTVRVRNGKAVTTDGPFAETKEQLGGYYLLDVSNLDEALKWAKKCPGALDGSIEVRAVMELPPELAPK